MPTTAQIRECEDRAAKIRRNISDLQSRRDQLLRRVEPLRRELGEADRRNDITRFNELRSRMAPIEQELQANGLELEFFRDRLHANEKECWELRRNRGRDAPSEDELRKTIDDPRYWRDGDPALARFVSDGFKRLYPDSPDE